MISKKQDKTIRYLAALMEELNLSEIRLHDGEHSIHLGKGYTHPHPPQPLAQADVATTSPTKEPGLIQSPMVGVAYLSPSPTKPPFVKAGDKVIKGQNLLIIEAMKSMNYITADQTGTVEKIVVENEQPVEYGTPLLYIRVRM